MSKAIVEEILEGVNKRIDEKFEALNEKSLKENSQVAVALREKSIDEIEDKDLRAKAYADAFVNEFMRTGKISEKAINYFQSSVDADGGYLVPQTLFDKIIKKANTMSAIRGLADVKQTSTNSMEFVIEKSAEGFEANWSGETDAKDDTTVEGFDKVTIECNDLYLKPKVTRRNLSDNAFDLEGYILEKINEMFDVKAGNAYINGTGTGQPFGLLTGFTSAVALGTTHTVTFAELNTLVYSLKQKYAKNGTWLMSRKTLGLINGITDTQGNPIFRQPELRQEGDKVDGYLLNYPVRVDDNMVDIQTATTGQIPIVFGDIKSAYKIVDHNGIYQERDTLTETGFVKYPTIMRTGGKRILDEAMVALKEA